jgi:hypothetical protein
MRGGQSITAPCSIINDWSKQICDATTDVPDHYKSGSIRSAPEHTAVSRICFPRRTTPLSRGDQGAFRRRQFQQQISRTIVQPSLVSRTLRVNTSKYIAFSPSLIILRNNLAGHFPPTANCGSGNHRSRLDNIRLRTVYPYRS